MAVSKWPLVVTTTAARAEALRKFLEPGYLGHTGTDALVRELLADIDRAVSGDTKKSASSE